VVVNQEKPADLVVRGWSKCANVPGEPTNDYSLYVDLQYADGTPLFGQIAAFATGTYDWQMAETVIRPEKPVRTATVHCLLRREKTGTAWFDDLFFGAAGSDQNLLRQGDFEGVSSSKPAELDGIYIDSSEGWGNELNYREGHFGTASAPPVFAHDDHKLALLTMFSTFEFVQTVEQEMRRRGKLMMANSTPWSWNILMPLLDVIGTETNWHPNKQWQPDSVAVLNLRRALCDQKPYCLLMNTKFEDWSRELTEKYFRRCLHWAVYPGFFSENAATNVYFASPTWYNRDRALFEQYVPLIIKLGQAGWEPVTYATVEPAGVLVERYGDVARGGPSWTVFNPTAQPQHYTLRIEGPAVGSAEKPQAQELLSGRQLAPERDGAQWKLTGDLGPEEVALWAFQR
jgi:hypothetical protein